MRHSTVTYVYTLDDVVGRQELRAVDDVPRQTCLHRTAIRMPLLSSHRWMVKSIESV